MPKQSKSKIEVVETTTAVNTPVVEQTAAAPKAKKESKPKAPKAPKTETAAPVVAAAPAAAPAQETVEEPAAEVAVSDDIAAQCAEFLTKLGQAGALFNALKAEFKVLEKKFSRELKVAQKSQAKRKRKSGNRQPSGFVKPTKISDELAKFLDKPVGTEMARTEVTRDINAYIRSHNLQDKTNGRKIIPDNKLKTLLKLKPSDELTYFNLQKYMSCHFEKAVKATTA